MATGSPGSALPVKGTVTAALEGDPPHAGRIRRSSRRRGFGPEWESRAMPSLGTALLSSPAEPVSESERLGFAGPALRASEPLTTRILGPKGCVCAGGCDEEKGGDGLGIEG